MLLNPVLLRNVKPRNFFRKYISPSNGKATRRHRFIYFNHVTILYDVLYRYFVEYNLRGFPIGNKDNFNMQHSRLSFSE